MDLYMVILRIVHILAGIFWVGAALVTSLFVQPTARDLGPAAAPFMSYLTGKKRLNDAVLAAAGLTVLAGLLLYWRVTDGLDRDIIGTAYGVSLTVGAMCAIIALGVGGSIVRPSINRAIEIGRTAAERSGPTPEKAAVIGALQARARMAGLISVALIVVAAAAMASARYL
jgi:hypothetical protein